MKHKVNYSNFFNRRAIMFKALTAGAKPYIALAVVIAIAVLFALWQHSKADLATVKADAKVMEVQKNAVIEHNGEQITKAVEVNKANDETLKTVVKAQETIKKSSEKITKIIDDNNQVKNDLLIEIQKNVDEERYVSPETVSSIQKVLDEIEPLVYPPQGEPITTVYSGEQLDVTLT